MAEDAKPLRLSPEHYLRQAAECRRMARIATVEHRAVLENMAEIWERLARDIERHQ